MIIVVTGPTGVGKTKMSIELAKRYDAEIINGDAFQCYKELNIGVAKPDPKYMNEVKHHLYSFVDVTHNYSIAEYQNNLRKTIDEVLSKGKNAIIVGGSGLYIRSALYDYAFKENEAVDMSKYEAMDNRTLHDELRKIDPIEADKIHMNNRKRVLRAIEIYLSSGESKSEQILAQQHKCLYDAKFFVREMDRDELYSRINKRVDLMIKEGLVEEVKNLYEKYGSSPRALQAIGYKETIGYFEGKYDLENMIELIKKNTRNYAKRQLTFIRHQFPVSYYKDSEDLLRIINNG